LKPPNSTQGHISGVDMTIANTSRPIIKASLKTALNEQTEKQKNLSKATLIPVTLHSNRKATNKCNNAFKRLLSRACFSNLKG